MPARPAPDAVRRRRPARDRLPRGVLVVCLLVAGTQMTWGLVVPVLPLYADRLGAGATALGLVVSVFGVGRLLTNVPAGLLAQRVDARRLLVGAVGGVALLTLATALVASTWQLVALRLLTGVAGGVAITVGQMVLAETDPARWGRTMSALQAYQLAGGSVGPVVGGVTVGIDARLPFVVAGLLLVSFAVVGSLRPMPERVAAAPAGRGERPARLWNRGLVAVCVVGFAVFLVRFGGQQYLAPVLAYDRAGLTSAQLGVVLGVVTVLGLLLLRLAGTVTDRYGRHRVVTVVTVLLGLAVLTLLGAEHAALVVAAVVLVGLLTTFSGPATGAYLAESAAAGHKGVAVGVYRTCGDVGTLVGPVALGALVGAGHWEVAVVVLAAVTVLAGLVFATLTARGSPRETEEG